MSLKDMPCQEGCLTLFGALNRLTVLRDSLEEPPFACLASMLSHLLQNDPLAAAKEYHGLCAALIHGNYRRVSGDLFRDFLIWVLTERENVFSAAAARGVWDEPLSTAMRADLKHMDVLFSLNSVIAKRWIGEKAREQRNPRRTQQKDNISVLSSAVWAGTTSRPLPQAAPAAAPAPAPEPLPLPIDENDFISWRYQTEEHREPYAADPSLEELYLRLDTSADRGLLLDDLWNYAATCGYGVFTRYRLFLVEEDGTLSGLPAQFLPEEDAFTFYQAQREQAMHNAIRFMRGEKAQNFLLTGGAGAGKTTQIFSLARELPELRLVYCPPGHLGGLARALPQLLKQPLKFLLFLDEFDSQDAAWPKLRAALSLALLTEVNLLVCAAARKAEDAFFPLRISLPPPQLKEFIELVQFTLLREGKDVDVDSIQNACIDYAAAAGVNGGSPLSFRSAAAIAQELLGK